MNLYIVRHAAAEERDPAGEDSQRPLTGKGRKKMKKAAKGLRALGVELDAILSSPYVRARETAEILADVFKVKDKIAVSDNLIPIGDPDLLLAEINEQFAVDNLCLVGHEPYLTTLIGLLAAEGASVSMDLKKGGVCRLVAEDLRHSRSALIDLFVGPGLLTEL